MRKPDATPAAAAFTDAELVAQTLAGSREAFGDIVVRYQTLICSISYSATGSLTQSEDVSQETFLTAWRKLRELREPGSLRPWLCAIARNLLHHVRRDQGRDPTHAAEPLDHIHESPAPEAIASAQAVSREEEAILWRSLERIPEPYREALVLFYRQHNSIERVAALLDISQETARQRLSRGRKLLQDEVTAFVEGALRESNPNADFCVDVLSALPVPTGLAGGLAGATKSGGYWSWFSWALVGLFASLLGSFGLVRLAPTPQVRRFTTRLLLAMWFDSVGLWIALALTQGLRLRQAWSDPTFALTQVGIYFTWAAVMAVLVIVMIRRFVAWHREISPPGTQARAVVPAKSAVVVAGLMTVGSLAWLVQLTWAARDMGALVLTIAVAGAVIAWIFVSPKLLHRTGRDAVSFAWVPAAAITGVILVLLNLRLDFWLAVLRGTDANGAHYFLPMEVIHSITALFLVWVAAVVFFTRPRSLLL